MFRNICILGAALVKCGLVVWTLKTHCLGLRLSSTSHVAVGKSVSSLVKWFCDSTYLIGLF